MSFLKSREKSKIIDGLEIIELDPFNDNRGEIWTLYDKNDWELGFAEDKLSISHKGVIRGLHGDSETDKIISCLNGSFFLVVVDAREQSSTYGNIQTFTISSKNPTTIFVPAGCLNGHQSLTNGCVFWYKWSKNYNGPENQVTCLWNDKSLNIKWPLANPILSDRDNNGVKFSRIRGI